MRGRPNEKIRTLLTTDNVNATHFLCPGLDTYLECRLLDNWKRLLEMVMVTTNDFNMGENVMKIKDALKLLAKCDPEAELCLETKSDIFAKKVYACTGPKNLVYLTDDLTSIRDDLKEDGFKVKEVK